MAGVLEDPGLDLVVGKGGSKEDNRFDAVVGQLEETVMEPAFQRLETEFGERNCHHFDDTEENKFIYTDLHKEYTAAVESYLVDALTRRVPGFKMSDFLKMLAKRPGQISEDLMDLLSSIDDFLSFKAMMLSYKAGGGMGGVDGELSGLTVTGVGS